VLLRPYADQPEMDLTTSQSWSLPPDLSPCEPHLPSEPSPTVPAMNSGFVGEAPSLRRYIPRWNLYRFGSSGISC
jgi:hypothetical protein